MASSELRKRVLICFKKLHKTRSSVFKDDITALQAARMKINEEFKKLKHVRDSVVINELVSHAEAVEAEMRTTIVQACEEKPGVYVAQLHPDTVRMDNVPFRDCKS